MNCIGCRAYVLQLNAREVKFPETKLRLEATANNVCLTLIHLGICQRMPSAIPYLAAPVRLIEVEVTATGE